MLRTAWTFHICNQNIVTCNGLWDITGIFSYFNGRPGIIYSVSLQTKLFFLDYEPNRLPFSSKSKGNSHHDCIPFNLKVIQKIFLWAWKWIRQPYIFERERCYLWKKTASIVTLKEKKTLSTVTSKGKKTVSSLYFKRKEKTVSSGHFKRKENSIVAPVQKKKKGSIIPPVQK